MVDLHPSVKNCVNISGIFCGQMGFLTVPCLPSPLRKDQEPYGSGGVARIYQLAGAQRPCDAATVLWFAVS